MSCCGSWGFLFGRNLKSDGEEVSDRALEGTTEVSHSPVQPLHALRPGGRNLQEVSPLSNLFPGDGPSRGDPRHHESELVKR